MTTFKPLDHQLAAQDTMKNMELTGHGGFLCDGMGMGKCLHPDTKVLLWEGGHKLAKNIQVGDMLIGDDSLPRKVYSTVTGSEMMYKIHQQKGQDYTVNESHILSLKISGHKGWYWYENKKQYIVNWFDRSSMKFRAKCFGSKYGEKNDRLCAMEKFRDTIPDENTLDITVKDYLALNASTKAVLKGYKVGVDFLEQDVCVDPYLLGAWLGDGHSSGFGFTNVDDDVISYVSEKLAVHNCTMTQESDDSITYRISSSTNVWRSNGFVKLLDTYNLRKNKHIPQKYLHNTRKARLQLLAGLIDTDGYLADDCCTYEIIQKRKGLAEDIAYLCRSLGFFVHISECEKSCMYKGEKKTGTYYKCVISGSEVYTIPCLLVRKQAMPRTQKKDVMVTNIEVEQLEIGQYCGFTIDGNRRFLIEDFTVTHNTITMSMYLNANRLKDKNKKDKTDLIVCPFSLLSTWETWLVKVHDWNKKPNEKKKPIPHILVYHGPSRKKYTNRLHEFDYVITTYAIISTAELAPNNWGRVVLDESHYIKNGLQRNAPKCAAAAFALGKKSKKNWCISGTPFNNNMKDIAAQALFVGTAPYNDPTWWKKNEKNEQQMAIWRDRFVIRRTKEGMLDPPTYHDIYVDPTKTEEELVASLRKNAETQFKAWKRARQMKDNQERIRLQGVILGLIQKLRIISNSFYSGYGAIEAEEALKNNAKVDRMVDDLDRLVDKDPKKGVVFFSQFTSFLEVFEQVIEFVMPGVEVLNFYGDMSKDARDQVVEEFNTSRSPRVILVSLMAGGVGLSLHHGSSTVMLAEPYYNPFAEQQAEERVHRLGQEHPVGVYRYYMRNSVENWIDGLKQKKLTLAGGLELVQEEIIPTDFNFDDIADLFKEHVTFYSGDTPGQTPAPQPTPKNKKYMEPAKKKNVKKPPVKKGKGKRNKKD